MPWKPPFIFSSEILEAITTLISVSVEPVLELTDVQATKSVKNGVEYITVKKTKLKCIGIKKLILNFGNLFQGNKELSKPQFYASLV